MWFSRQCLRRPSANAALKSFRSVLGLQDFVSGRLQPLAERPADQLLVIDDENPDRSHARILDG